MKNQNHIGLLVGCFTSLMLYVLLFFWDASLELSELRICLAAFRFCRPCFLPAVVVMPAGKCPMDPLAPPLYPVPCGPGRSGLLLWVCGQRLGHFGGRYPPMLVHCPSGGVCFGLADLRWETPAQAGYGRAGHSAGGLCETQSYGWPFGDFELMDLPAIVVLAMGIWLLLRKEGRIKREE